MKKERKLYVRTLYISVVIMACLFCGLYFSAKAFENTKKIGFGEYRKAIYYEEGKLKIFDYEVEIYNNK